MKKRKSTLDVFRRSRFVLYDFAFDFTSKQKSQFRVRALSNSRELKHYEIVFDPPLNKREATQSSIRLIHMPTKRSDVRLVVLPKNIEQNASTVHERRYLTFDTHSVQLDPTTGQVILMYMSVQNNQMDGSDGAPPVMNPLFPLKHERYHSLSFFPPDIELIPHDRPIDCAKVPQNMPMKFKPRGELTGTNIYGYLGWFVPEPADAAQWIADKKAKKYEVFTGMKALNMRFGTIKEDVVILNLLANNPLLNYYECGYIAHPTEPSKWGASPDGLLQDTEPQHIPPELKGHDFDFTKGVCEIKSSRFNCRFSGYHIPQCMWEMACSGVSWCDLVRYCEKRVMDVNIRQYVTQKQCKKIRLFRHLQREEELVTLALKAQKVQKQSIKAFVDLVHTEEYVALRRHYDNMATTATTHATDIPIAEELIQQMTKERLESITMQDEDIPSLHPAIDRIEQRQPEIFRLYQEVGTDQEFLRLVTEQIQDYGELMQTKL